MLCGGLLHQLSKPELEATPSSQRLESNYCLLPLVTATTMRVHSEFTREFLALRFPFSFFLTKLLELNLMHLSL
jgi:hypothetical protein